MHEIFKALKEGLPFSGVNVIVLAIVLAIVLERFITLQTKFKRVNIEDFMSQVRKLVQAGNIDRAIKLCEAENLPFLNIIKSGLTQVNRGEESVIASMEERMSEVLPDLEKRIGALWSLANIATLIGLLGTISGLIKAFAAVAFAEPAQRSAILSGGISEAMWNTALGLFIAVLCMIFHLFLHGSAKKIKADMERATMKLENLLTIKAKA